ncbi:MAG: NUDIX domain-containing protein [Nitrososphaerota archaeon]|nr:NUDIX domain-containing protein [Nitrososphaerota archaeon]MDG6969604.1 NUDIX domain-containing protein [Nitrososphaerota archaeon]
MDAELIARISKSLASQEPQSKGLQFAAVSIIIRGRRFPSVLLIKRAERSGDPWSGQIAYPGGKTQPGDGTARSTATRETVEEAGFDLGRAAEFMGYANATTAHTGTMDAVPPVFILKEGVEIKPNERVASYHWVDLEELLAPEASPPTSSGIRERTSSCPPMR